MGLVWRGMGFVSSALGLAVAAWAGAPALISYQGKLADAEGNPVTATRAFRVGIFDAAAGGDLLFEETVAGAEVKNGVFSLLFGAAPSTGGLGEVLRKGPDRWLQVTLVGEGGARDETFLPRQRLASVPYAQAVAVDSVSSIELANGAVRSEDLDPSGNFLFHQRVAVGAPLSPAFSPSYTLHVSGTIGLTRDGQTGELKTRYVSDPSAPGFYATYAP